MYAMDVSRSYHKTEYRVPLMKNYWLIIDQKLINDRDKIYSYVFFISLMEKYFKIVNFFFPKVKMKIILQRVIMKLLNNALKLHFLKLHQLSL